MMELKKIRTEKYMMSVNCPAISDTSINKQGAANSLWSTPIDQAMILKGLNTSEDGSEFATAYQLGHEACVLCWCGFEGGECGSRRLCISTSIKYVLYARALSIEPTEHSNNNHQHLQYCCKHVSPP